MTNEHEKLPSGNLAEAIAAFDRNDATTGQYSLMRETCRKYLALEPLLRELCEARGKATSGKWKVCGYRPYRIINRDPAESTYEWGDDKFPALIPDMNHAGNSKFIATAANITARIREVVGE